ncbi:Tetraspanin-3-like [Oopsacas minuta]|uniref:Tetraspanin n=1 Tax=Oopsacas minuta TaxID=111878 RepID=A0AAV7K1B2_9METZ|nr:Tetraspanin-3-like [Oopsacas minuta]
MIFRILLLLIKERYICKIVSKTCLFFFNIFLWIVAVAVLAGVAYYFYTADLYKGVAGNKDIFTYNVAPLVILVLVAIMLFVVSVLGLIASCFNVRVLIILYGILLACVVAAQVAGGMLVIGFQGPVRTELATGFRENLPIYNVSIVFSTAVDTIQSQLGCCGVDSYTDWENIGIPASCCINTITDCTPPNKYNIYTKGCGTKLNAIIKQSATISFFVAIVLALIQASGVVVAFILGCCCCRKEQDESMMEMRRNLPKY